MRKGSHHTAESKAKNGAKHRGKIVSQETRELMSIAHAGERNGFFGKHHDEATIEKNRQAHIGKPAWNKGKPMSEEMKQHLSEVKKGRTVPPEVRKKMSEAHKKNPVRYWLGKEFGEEHIERIRRSSTGRTHTEETKKKLSGNHKGIPKSQEHREKLSKSHKGLLAGEKNPAWNGGITPFMVQLHSSPEMDMWRRKVIHKCDARDWYSGIKLSGNIEVHHIRRVADIIEQYGITTMEQARLCSALWDPDNGVVMSKENHSAHHSMWSYK